MNCCFCNHLAWSTEPDTYPIDPFKVEYLHFLLNNIGANLSDMIVLAKAYNDAVDSVKDTIEKIHNSCKRCLHCNSTINVTVVPDTVKSQIITHATQYYLGLTDHQYNVIRKIGGCYREMIAIDTMIGMEEIKHEFVRLLKFLATIEAPMLARNSFLMHMVISGPPGHGKTEIAKLLGNAFRKSGLLSEDKFVIATRADLIGAYCGHTAKNTTAMFDKARGGVIFIDEVYSLGNPEKRDVFTGECINTINQLLSERSDTLCIIAGYEKEIAESFFSYNPGLERRFPWRFKIKEYTEQHLVDIFYKKMADMSYTVQPGALLDSDIKKFRPMFANAGGDIVNLASNCILAYHDNNFLMAVSDRPVSRPDILAGLERYVMNRKVPPVDPGPPPHMYS